MTMIVRVSVPAGEIPIENLELDLDSSLDLTRFEALFGCWITDATCHLYPGEKIEIKCIERIDEGMF